MQIIELEKYKPSAEDPRRLEYAGQRTGVEVYKELKQRLENLGMLPDEYFLLNGEWEQGKEIPRDADLFVTTDYGGSEGIYLDVYLKWYEDNEPVTKSFITGKTLAETGAAMDRMFLISSAITKAFHGDHGQYDRYQSLHPEHNAGEMLVSLSPEEHKLFVDALIQRRENMLEQVDGTEKLLRRMVGNISEYMDVVGERPLHISDYDRTILAVRDGDLNRFKELYPRVMDRADDLLIETAGRCGDVGRKMTVLIVSEAKGFDNSAYLAAGRTAVETGDTERVRFLMEQAEAHVEKLDRRFCGGLIDHALEENNLRMAEVLVREAKPEQIAGAPASLLYRASMKRNISLMMDLIRKGAKPGEYAQYILQPLTYEGHRTWEAEEFLKAGMQVAPNDYRAMHTCVKNGALSCAELILDQGMNFDQYVSWAYERGYGPEMYSAVTERLQEHWKAIKPETAPEQEQNQWPVMGGISF